MAAIVQVSQSSSPVGTNRLIEALPRRERERLLAGCERVELRAGEVLWEFDARIRHVYFPTQCFVSLTIPNDGRTQLEVGLIGDEGLVGFSLILGVCIAPQRAIVQGPGAAWRMSAAAFCREMERSVVLRRRLNGYLYVMLRQLAQAAICTHYHEMDSRLARRLLMTGDRAHCDAFYITQESISSMLGVRRAGVNRAAGLLQDRKLIRYSRGHLAILDRRALRAAACACYDASNEGYAKILV
jgi:CRP-like cAMP-binding protein